MAITISTKAANSLVLKNCFVSVDKRRAVLPTRPRLPAAPAVASDIGNSLRLMLGVFRSSFAGALSRLAVRMSEQLHISLTTH
jgi:hypothetical protein